MLPSAAQSEWEHFLFLSLSVGDERVSNHPKTCQIFLAISSSYVWPVKNNKPEAI